MNVYTQLFGKVPHGCRRISHGADHVALEIDGAYRASLTVRTAVVIVLWSLGFLALRHTRNLHTGEIGAPPMFWLTWAAVLLALALCLLHAVTRSARLTLTEDRLTYELRSVLWHHERECDRNEVTAVALVERQPPPNRTYTPVEPTPTWALWVRTSQRSIRILQRALNENADPLARLISDWSGARVSIEPRRREWFFSVDV